MSRSGVDWSFSQWRKSALTGPCRTSLRPSRPCRFVSQTDQSSVCALQRQTAGEVLHVLSMTLITGRSIMIPGMYYSSTIHLPCEREQVEEPIRGSGCHTAPYRRHDVSQTHLHACSCSVRRNLSSPRPSLDACPEVGTQDTAAVGCPSCAHPPFFQLGHSPLQALRCMPAVHGDLFSSRQAAALAPQPCSAATTLSPWTRTPFVHHRSNHMNPCSLPAVTLP